MAIKKDPKSGKWIAQVGSGKNGSRRSKIFKFKKDAQDWVREQENYFNSEASKCPFGPETRVEEMMDLYLQSIAHRTHDYKREVRVSLLAVFKLCRIKLFEDIIPKRLTPYKLREDLNPRTKNKHVGFVKSMCRYLESEGWIYKSPISGIRSISSIKPEKRALTEEETEELMRTVYSNSPDIWFPIIFTALRLALRKGELLTLEWSDINFRYKRVRIGDKPHLIIEGKPESLISVNGEAPECCLFTLN